MRVSIVAPLDELLGLGGKRSQHTFVSIVGEELELDAMLTDALNDEQPYTLRIK